MKLVFFENFHKDYCELCVYKDLCSEKEKEACMNLNEDNIDYLASILYRTPTHVFKRNSK